MSLTSGQRLGPYEIESPLGTGGMGEVYRARDTRLDRTVAVKVLPARLAEHPLGRERFEREAKAVSALSHPHICALYDVGEAEGVTFIVMEHLEGESLADRLSRGALPLDQVLKLAGQVADALDRAHRAGIVHRDLKPGNVMVTRSGAKLLDFGLAKSPVKKDATPPSGTSAPTEGAPGASPLETSAPTEAKPPLTEAGTVLGTFQYMAPEQLEGEEADSRADIWALGCLLYEMATGQPPFLGKSQASLISSIMRDAPAPVADRQPLTPAALEHVISRCLEKDKQDRWQSAHDVAEELTWIQGAGRTAGARSRPVSARPGPGWVAAGLAVIAAAALGSVLGRSLVSRSPAGAASASPTPQQLTFHRGVERHPALAPGGRLVAYVSNEAGNDDIFIQRVDGRNRLNLTASSAEADSEPAFSPDGNQIAFRSERSGGGIFVMGATGESVRRLSDMGHDPSWSPDGTRLVVSTERIVDPMGRQGTAELWTIVVGAGETRRLYAGDAVQPAWSPDGGRIAFWRVDAKSGQRDLATIGVEGTAEPEAVTNDVPVDWNPVWAADGGSLLFLSDRGGTMNLWRVAIDPDTGGPAGKPVLVGAPAEKVGGLSPASADGSLAFESHSAMHHLHSLPLDPVRLRATGERRTVYAGALPIGDVHPSPDGNAIAMTTWGSREDLYVLQADGAELRQLTSDPSRHRGPQWSPDGSEIAFYSNRSGSYQLWIIRPDGSGLRQLTDLPDGAWFPYWSPNGARIAFPSGRRTCIFSVADAPVSSVECLPDLSDDHWFQVRDWSPDGRWLVGSRSLRAGEIQPDLLLWSFETSEYQPIGARSSRVRWLPDSRHLVVLGEGGQPVLVDVVSAAVHDPGWSEAEDVLEPERLSLSRDGRTVLLRRSVLESNVWLLSPPE